MINVRLVDSAVKNQRIGDPSYLNDDHENHWRWEEY
jgi:hypothetical protein